MIQIIADTTASLPLDQAKSLGIPYLPQIIIFGEESFRDDSEMDTDTFLIKLKASNTLPKTAAPAPELYHPYYAKYSGQGDTTIVITPSKDLSGTFRGAEIGAQDFPSADIRIIDSRTVAGGLGSLVLCADQWVKKGLTADEVVKNIEAMAKREKIFFLVDTLEYLYKGGRIGGAQALFGSILQVKPLLTLKDGRTEPVESQRTKKRALARLKEIIQTDCPRSPEAYLSVMYGEAEEEARQFAAELSALLGIKDIPIYRLPPAILVHAGPGSLAVSYFTAE
ncbi:MAG: DegV family protein [Anaerolineaceae bacterium]